MGRLVAFAVVLFSISIICPSSLAFTNELSYINAPNTYKEALSKAILFFEGQRAGKLPPIQRVKWRGDSALNDGKPDNVNLSGGYYDAGDNLKFTWPMSFTVTLLSWASIEYEKDISSVGEIAHLREAISWGTDFIINAHSFSNGNTTAFYAQVGDGDADHKCWERPEDMDTPRTLYKISPTSPGTELAAEAAAALASASIVFKTVDSSYSSKLLWHSKVLFEFADSYRGTFSTSCPYYCSYSGFQDELLWAAAWLYKASGENYYLTYVTNNQGWSKTDVTEFSWDNKLAGAQTLLANEYFKGTKALEKFKTDAESFVCSLMPGSGSVKTKTTQGGLLYIRDSSNLQYVTSATMILLKYSRILEAANVGGVKCPSSTFTASQIKTFAKSQVDYILGNNPKKMSYMVGLGTYYPTHLHHRGSSIPSIHAHPNKIGCNDGQEWFNSGDSNPNIHEGALVGGPDSNDQFTDSRSDYSHLEPTTYMNAAFVGSVAAFQDQASNNEELLQMI